VLRRELAPPRVVVGVCGRKRWCCCYWQEFARHRACR
jgi:hypothetical protein